MEPKEDIEQAIKWIREKHGDGFRSYIIPSGNNVLPSSVGGWKTFDSNLKQEKLINNKLILLTV